MRKIIEYKDKLTNEVTEKLQNSKSFIIFKYSGLTAQEITELRKKLAKTNSKLAVYKNNILQRALEKTKIEGFGTLSGPNAIAWSMEDEIAPLKEIYELFKTHKFLEIKGSYLEKSFMDEKKTQSIASLPNREGLYGMFLSCLTSPIRSVLYALKAVADTKN